MAEEEKVKLFVSSACGPCEQVRKMIEEGRFNLPDIDLIDVTTEEGFPYVKKMGLTKIPVAYKGDKVCKLLMDDESLMIDCGDNPPAEIK